ncbi:MAG: DUF4276 family protein [Bacteroidales bacterium]|nr:DUF4276 family protein [Bacteroidales bacterium]
MEYRLEILTEERSMAKFLRQLLPNVLPPYYQLDKNCFIRPHEGKSELLKAIPKKLKAYQHDCNTRVLIIHDQDSNDCIHLKNKLIELCAPYKVPVVIRIACRELENWYLGDLPALKKVYPKLKVESLMKKSKYRNPDLLKEKGSKEIIRLIPDFSKSYAAEKMPLYMDINNNLSPSFRQFLIGLKKITV